MCPQCGKPLVYRKSRTGQLFIGCSNFPNCRYIENIDNPDNEETRICPECGAKLILRRSKKGLFHGCSNYPKCTHVEPYKKDGTKEN